MKQNFTLALLMATALFVVSPSWAKNKSIRLPANSCLTEDSREGDEPWELLEKSVPACQRAVVILSPRAKLDLGVKPSIKTYANGRISVKATILSGSGSYNVDDKNHDLAGKTLWLSLDRCQLRNTILTNAKGREVSFKHARYLESTEELAGIADGRQFTDFVNDCQK